MDVTTDDDSEWEYEYDENETEDFYVILEIPDPSSTKPKSKADELFAPHDPTKAKPKPKAGAKKRSRAAVDAEDKDEPEQETANDADPAPPVQDIATAMAQHILPNIQTLTLAEQQAQAKKDAPPKGLQILDLAGDEPMIKYRDQIYSCRWGSSIGSDLLFMRPPRPPTPVRHTSTPVSRSKSATPSQLRDYKPLRIFPSVDLLAIGSARLIARPATIERRPDAKSGSVLDPPPGKTDDYLSRQARFLKEIAKIRAEKGEMVGNLGAVADAVLREREGGGEGVASPARGGRGRGRGGRGSRGGAARGRGRGRGRGASKAPEVTVPEAEDDEDAGPVIDPEIEMTAATFRPRRASTQSVERSKIAFRAVMEEDDEDG